MVDRVVIKKVSRGKNQNRVTIPKEWKSDYVALKQVELNIFTARKKYGKFVIFLFLLFIIPMSEASILNPNEPKSGNYAGTTLNDSFNELTNAWYRTQNNVTQIIDGKLWVPWYSGDNVCGPSNLQSGGNCNVATVNMTINCMVSDEFSQVGLVLAQGSNATRFDQFYQMVRAINSSRGVIPSWKVLRNGTTISTCRTDINANCDTASDATARFIIALYTAGNNSAYIPANRSRYRDLANNMTADMMVYELNNTASAATRLGNGNVTHWLAGGSVARLNGLESDAFVYTGYYQDAAIAFLASYRQNNNATYLAVSRNITLQYLAMSQYNGTTFSVPPGVNFKIQNITGIPYANCTNTCDPPRWDSVDAPRAFGMGQLEYYVNLSGLQAYPNLTSYMDGWRDRFMKNNNSVVLQYFQNGTNASSNQSGYFAQGLQSLAWSGDAYADTNRTMFNQTIRNALAHYQSSTQSYDSAACFGVYGQAMSMRSLGMGLGFDEQTFNPAGQASDTDPPIVNLNAPTNGSSFTNPIISFNATLSDDVSLLNATFFLWNSTGTLINQTNLTANGPSSTTSLSVTLPYLGLFKWNYLAFDTSGNGNWNSTNFTVRYIDTSAPTVNIVYPTNTTYLTNVTSLTYTVTDNIGVQACWRTFDSGATNITLTCGENVSMINSSNGQYTWIVYANDSSGNVGSGSITFSIDNQQFTTNELCNSTLLGFQEFGNMLPILIIGLMGGTVLLFIMGKGETEDVDEVGESTGMIIAAIVAVGIGAVIITTIAGSGGC